MNQAKIDALVNQLFVAVGLIIMAFFPKLAFLEPLLGDIQIAIKAIIGGFITLRAVWVQYKSNRDAMDSEAQIVSLNIPEPSWGQGFSNYFGRKKAA